MHGDLPDRTGEPRPTAAPPLSSRRGFLWSGVAGLTGAAVWSLASPDATLASEQETALAGEKEAAAAPLRKQFEAAAAEFGVPFGVLLAMGYVNTRLETPSPDACDYREGDPEGRGAYGIMALVRNPFSDTLGKAARLIGLPAERLRTEQGANVRGGAALLADSQGPDRPTGAGGWLGAVHGGGGHGTPYSATSGLGAGELYAGQVEQALRGGFAVRTRSGERVSLSGRGSH